VPHLREFGERGRAHALGRRIGAPQILMLLLDLDEFAEQAVEFCVADFRIVEHIVAMIVVLEFLA
jgi:hypothetical protein